MLIPGGEAELPSTPLSSTNPEEGSSVATEPPKDGKPEGIDERTDAFSQHMSYSSFPYVLSTAKLTSDDIEQFAASLSFSSSSHAAGAIENVLFLLSIDNIKESNSSKTSSIVLGITPAEGTWIRNHSMADSLVSGIMRCSSDCPFTPVLV